MTQKYEKNCIPEVEKWLKWVDDYSKLINFKYNSGLFILF